MSRNRNTQAEELEDRDEPEDRDELEDGEMSLRDELQEGKEEWPKGCNSHFIPISAVGLLVTKERVRKEFRKLYPRMDLKKVDNYTHRICDSMPKVFTIFLCSPDETCRRAIRAIIDEKITDADLPLARVYPKGRARDRQSQSSSKKYRLGKRSHASCPRDDHTSCEIKALSKLKTPEIQNLCRDQWLVQAPVFKSSPDDIKHHRLDDNVVLPYVEDQELEPGAVKVGGYSEVWGVRIHSAHQRMLRSKDPLVRLNFNKLRHH